MTNPPRVCGIFAAKRQTSAIGITSLNTSAIASRPPSRQLVGIGYLLLSGLGVVFLPTTAKLAYEADSNVMTVAFARGIVSTLLLLLVVLLLRQSLRLPRNMLGPSLVAGIAGAVFVYGVYGAILTINISLALLILYLYPMVLATWSHLTGSSRLAPLQWLWGLLAMLGLALILGLRFDQISPVGVALALMAMLATVVITLTNVRVTEVSGSLVANFYMSLWSFLIFAAALALFGDFRPPQTTLGWGGLIGNGIAYCVSWVAFFAGARILGAARASMITLVEPPLAALFAWFIFGETFTPLQWAGFALVLLALLLFETAARRPA